MVNVKYYFLIDKNDRLDWMDHLRAKQKVRLEIGFSLGWV